MNSLVHLIIIRKEEAQNWASIKDLFQEKIHDWIEEEYDKGWLIEILIVTLYNKGMDTNQYVDVHYRATKDPIHLELLERLKIGL